MRWLAIALCVLAVAVFLALALYSLGERSYWTDEIATVRSMRQAYGDMVLERMRAGHLPVYFSALWLWVRQAGESEFMTRLPSVVFAVGALGVLAGLLRRLQGWSAAVLGLWFAAAGVGLLLLGQQARMYTLTPLLTLGLAWQLVRTESSPRRQDVLQTALLTALVAYTYYSALLVVASLALYLLCRRRPVWPLLAGLALGVLSLAPWLIVHLLQHSPAEPLDWVADEPVDVLEALWRFSFDKQLLWYSPNARLALWACLLLLLGRGVWQLGYRGRVLVFMWLVPLLLAALAAWLGGKNVLPQLRYFSTPMLCQAAVLGAAVAGPWDWRGLWRLAPAGAVLAAGFYCALVHTTSLSVNEWRQMADLVRQHRDANREPIVVVAARTEQFDYYHREPVLLFDEVCPPSQPGAAEQAPPALPAEAQALWLVFEHRQWQILEFAAKSDPQNLRGRMAWLERQFPRVRKFEHPWGRVWRLQREGSAQR